jgi:hypothetical protein
VKPYRSGARGRIVVTRDGQEAVINPAPEPFVEPRSGLVPARPTLGLPPALPELPPAPAQPSPSERDAPPKPIGANSVDAAPAPVASDSVDAAPAPVATASVDTPSTDRTSRPEWCSIVFAPVPHGGEFHVLTVQEGGRRQVVARSDAFRTPLWCRILPLRQLPNIGAPRRAHDLLVERLVASGWQQMQTRGRWYDTALVRTQPGP